MKVLYVTGMYSSKYGGLEKFIIELLKNGVKLSVIYNNIPQPAAYYDDLKKYNAGIYSIHGNILQRSWQTFRIIRKEKPDIVHYHFGFIVYILFFIVKIFSPHTKQVLTQHCEYLYTSLFMRLLTRICYKSLDLVISVSKGVRNKLVTIIGDSKNNIVSYLGVSKRIIQNRKLKTDLNISDDFVVLTSIGFDIDVKGFDVLAHAIKLLSKDLQLPQYKIIIIGLNDSEKIKFHRILNELDVEEKFISVGIRNDVDDFLFFTDIYIQPSRTEAISLSIMEALMYNIPIIGTNVGGVSEVCINNYNGLLVEKENPEQLAQAIKSLLLDKDFRKYLGNNSSKQADKFRLESNVYELIKIYQKLLNH